MFVNSAVRAVFTGEFHYTSTRRNVGWSAYPNPSPQIFPREFIAAAIGAGQAIPVPKRRASAAPSPDAAVAADTSGE